MEYKAFSRIVAGIFLAVVMLLGCSDKVPDSSEWVSVALRDVPKTLIAGDTLELSMSVKYGSQREQLYDFGEDDLGIQISADSDMAEYLGAGFVKVLKHGTLTLKVSSSIRPQISDHAVLDVLEREWSNVIAQPLHSRLIYVSASLPDNVLMSAFDVSSGGDVYMCDSSDDKTYVCRMIQDGTGDYMTFSGIESVTCFCIEEDGADVYVWISIGSGVVARV